MASETIVIGCRVELLGLSSGEMNGLVGKVERWNNEQQRWGVRLDGADKLISLKENNVSVVSRPGKTSRSGLSTLEEGRAWLAENSKGEGVVTLK